MTQPIIGNRNLVFVCSRSSGASTPYNTVAALSSETGEIVWKHIFNKKTISGSCLYESPQTKSQLCILSLTNNDFLNGTGEVIAFNPAGEIEWHVELSDNIISAPVIHKNSLLVTDGGDSLTIVDLETHEVRAHYPFKVRASLSAVTVDLKKVIIPCRENRLIALDIDSGKPIWDYVPQYISQNATNEWLDKTPMVDGHYIYTASTKGNLTCLNKKNGKAIWTKNIEADTPLTQIAVGKNGIFIGGEKGVYAISKNNGAQLWHFKTNRRIASQVQLVGNLLFATGEDHFAYTLNNETGALLSKFEMDRRIEIPAKITSDHIYVADRGASLKAFQFSLSQAASLPEPKAIKTMEKKAEKLVKGGKWLEAIKLFERLGNFPARANALKEYARFISTSGASSLEKAMAWEKAGDAFKESGDPENRRLCIVEIARHKREPLFELEIQENVFTLESWSQLTYTLRNIGFGLARFVNVIMKADSPLFEWQANQTTTSHSLPADREFSGKFNIKPLNSGNGVPLELTIEYLDHFSQTHTINKSFSVNVMKNHSEAQAFIQKRQFKGQGIAKDPIELRDIMAEAFNRDEFESIVYEIGLNVDDFPGAISKAMLDLINAVNRQGKLEKLLTIIVRERDYLVNQENK